MSNHSPHDIGPPDEGYIPWPLIIGTAFIALGVASWFAS